MTVVLADDFSGAAEVAGIAVEAGWTVEVQTDFQPGTRAPLVVVDTDSRSLPAQRAAAHVTDVVHRVRAAGESVLFKKVDSVLRGPVVAELAAARRAGGYARALLVPANPTRGRVIVDGRYYVGGMPLDQTLFALDPEHPARSSHVLGLLGMADETVTMARLGQGEPARGELIVGEAETPGDVRRWAERLDEQTLAAGAAEFFSEWLRRLPRPAREHDEVGTEPRVVMDQTPPSGWTMVDHDLIVCGSAAAWARGRPAQCQEHGVPVIVLDALPCPDAARVAAERDGTVAMVVEALGRQRCVMIALGSGRDEPSGGTPKEHVERLAAVVAGVVQLVAVERLWVEGGMTASAVARRLHWQRFAAARPLLPGVTPLRPICPTRTANAADAARDGRTHRPQLWLIPKPGSYDWPEQVWRNRD